MANRERSNPNNVEQNQIEEYLKKLQEIEANFSTLWEPIISKLKFTFAMPDRPDSLKNNPSLLHEIISNPNLQLIIYPKNLSKLNLDDLLVILQEALAKKRQTSTEETRQFEFASFHLRFSPMLTGEDYFLFSENGEFSNTISQLSPSKARTPGFFETALYLIQFEEINQKYDYYQFASINANPKNPDLFYALSPDLKTVYYTREEREFLNESTYRAEPDKILRFAEPKIIVLN